MRDLESLLRYYDALRTGDPDRQLQDGYDLVVVKWAIDRIRELESALKVIHTWASVEWGVLNSEQVREICDKALGRVDK